MTENKYLRWLAETSGTSWWHDSADPDELADGLANGACGVTTNPVLVAASLAARPDHWTPALSDLPAGLEPSARAEKILERITVSLAEELLPVFERSGGSQGYVCAQVNPGTPGDARGMIAMARRIHQWAPNMAVKLPATRAGLEALEACAAMGLTLAVTASFTVPQALAVAERFREGRRRAEAAGIAPGRCFAVIMAGRLDDYLRDVAMDRNAEATAADLTQAGLAVVKRAYALYREKSYETTLLVAAMRGPHHAVELAGAELILSIHPSIQAKILQSDPPLERRIDLPVPEEVLNRLATIPEFLRAYEPGGLQPEDFITYGVTQKTLSQFVETGWKPLEQYHPREQDHAS